MFEKLLQLPWSKIRGSYIPHSREVPDHLQKLQINNKEIQAKYCQKLEYHIVLSGDLSEAAYYVITFLLEILANNLISEPSDIYDLLCQIAVACNDPRRKFTDIDGKEKILPEACLEVLAQGIDLYIRDLWHPAMYDQDDPTKVKRGDAHDLLALLPEYRDVIERKIKQELEKHPEKPFVQIEDWLER